MNLSWEVINPSHCGCADWTRWLESDRHIDPYLVWADVTAFVGYGGLNGDTQDRNGGNLPILVEMTRAGLDVPSPGAGAQGCCVDFGLFEINQAYVNEDSETKKRTTLSRYVTGTVTPSKVAALLNCCDAVDRFQLGLPRIPLAGDRMFRFGGPTGGVALSQVVVGIIDDGCPFAQPALQDSTGKSRVFFLWDQDHRRRPGYTKDGVRWREALGFGYGAELTRIDIQVAMLHGGSGVSPGDEYAAYKRADYVPIKAEPGLHSTSIAKLRDVGTMMMLPSTHGASAVDLAVGNKALRGDLRHGQGLVPPGAGTDYSPAWPVVFVQLPTRTTLDTSGGSLGVHVLDGVRYIAWRAQQIPYRKINGEAKLSLSEPFSPQGWDDATVAAGQKKPVLAAFPENFVVINISYGAMAGPHDGTSILERALEDFVKEPADIFDMQTPRRTVVLSAGNANGSKTHAQLVLTQGDKSRKTLTWTLGPDNPLESYLEVWLPDRTAGSTSPRSTMADQFLIKVKPPGLRDTCTVHVGQAAVLMSGDPSQRTPIAAVIFSRCVAQGLNGTMVLLAARPTSHVQLDGTPLQHHAPHGEWEVEVCFGPASTVQPGQQAVIHAWAERNDKLFGGPRRQQSRVVSDDPVPVPTEYFPSVLDVCHRSSQHFTPAVPKPFQPDFSFSSIVSGTPSPRALDKDVHATVIVAGGFRVSDGEMASYSGGGPGRGGPLDNPLATAGMCEAPSPANTGIGDTSRRQPDVDAPSDTSAAVPGLRTIGFRPGSTARLSGTSAAAPGITRYAANKMFRVSIQELCTDPLPMHNVEPAALRDKDPSAATQSQIKDDRYRRGRFRLRPWAEKPTQDC